MKFSFLYETFNSGICEVSYDTTNDKREILDINGNVPYLMFFSDLHQINIEIEQIKDFYKTFKGAKQGGLL